MLDFSKEKNQEKEFLFEYDTKSLWKLENFDYRLGGEVKWNSPIRIRHF